MARAGSETWTNRNWLALVTPALAAAIAFQLAATGWAMLGPIGPFGRVQAAQTGAPAPGFDWAVLTRFDPFFRTLAPGNGGPGIGGQGNPGIGEAVIAQSGVDLGLTLFAVRRDARGAGGSAIVGTGDGRQIAVQVGEEAIPGLKLHAILADGAVFQRGAELLELKFPAGSGAAAGTSLLRPAESEAGGASAAAQLDYQIDPKSFFQAVRLSPSRDGERLLGLIIGPQSDAQTLAAAGLRRGDVVLSVNGVALNTASAVETAANSLAGREKSVITYERQGKSGSVAVRVVKP